MTETGNDVVMSTAGGPGASGDRAHEETGADAADLAPVLVLAEPDPRWVDAGPFRAHLKHLMSVGSLSVPEVAVVLGLSTPAVRHLLQGRSGRLQRRISPHTARRLLLVRAADVRGLRWCLTPAGAARTSLRRLHTSGWPALEVAAAVGFGLDELGSLEHHTHCNRLLAVRLVGLARELPSTRDDQDLTGMATAA
jgi:hypothetical protein